MATELGKAYVQIVPSAQGISGAIESALGGEATAAGMASGANFSSAMGKGIAAAGGIAAGALAAGTVAVAGMTTAIISGTGSIAEYGDNIDKMSQKMGMTSDAYQEWDAVMQHSGTSIESMQASMKTLANAAETGNKAFAELGITEKDLATMNQQELFEATIRGLQEVDDTTQRTYIAGKLLGRGATELGALLNTSAEETQAMRDRVHELGGVMSEDAVKAAAHYQDSLQDMTTAFDGIQRGMMSQFLPSITTVMDGLTELFSGNGDKGLGMINQGVSDFIDNLTDVLPKLITTGSEIVVSLTSAIVENLPALVDAAIQAIQVLGQGIIDNLPMLLEAATQIITNLATNIGQAAPEIIPDAVNMIIDTILMLLENVDALVDGAIALITGLAEGLINALPILIERLPEIIIKIIEALVLNAPKLATVGPQLIIALVGGIIQSIPQLVVMAPRLVSELATALVNDAPQMIDSGIEQVKKMIEGITQMIPELLNLPGEIVGALFDTFMDVAPKLVEAGENLVNMIGDGINNLLEDAKQWGIDLMESFAAGIEEKISYVKDLISDLASAVSDLIGFSEPEKGPLSDFHTYAPDMMKLFAQGIKDNTELVTDQVKKSFDIKDAIMGDVDVITSSQSEVNGNGGFVQNLTINAPTELDPSEIARMTKNMNREFILQLRTT